MKRRRFIEVAGIAGAAVLAGNVALGEVAKGAEPDVSNSLHLLWHMYGPEAVARQMVYESGEKWLAAQDRTNGKNPILVSQGGPACIEITRNSEGWVFAERDLTPEEKVGMLDGWDIGALIVTDVKDNGDIHGYRSRGYVKNGSSPEWGHSVHAVVIRGAKSLEFAPRDGRPIPEDWD